MAKIPNRGEEKKKGEEETRAHRLRRIVLALLLPLVPLEFSVVAGADEGVEVLITDFFSCGRRR